MDQGQLYAAKAAETRRLELGLSQRGTGVDPKTWRQFVEGEKWPETMLTQRRIESHLEWHAGALGRIAAGQSTPADEAMDSPRQRIETQDQAEAILGRMMLQKEAARRLVVLLRTALAERDFETVQRLADEIDEIFRENQGGSPE